MRARSLPVTVVRLLHTAAAHQARTPSHMHQHCHNHARNALPLSTAYLRRSSAPAHLAHALLKHRTCHERRRVGRIEGGVRLRDVNCAAGCVSWRVARRVGRCRQDGGALQRRLQRFETRGHVGRGEVLRSRDRTCCLKYSITRSHR